MTVLKKKLILIFDTNIFFTGIDFNVFKENIYTTPKIIEEIDVRKYYNKNRNILTKIQVAIENRKLILKEPNEKFIKIVREKSKITGDLNSLSEADMHLIALTLELSTSQNNDIILYSNDYSIQNLCSELKLKFAPLYKKGIKKRILFEIYCPHCKNIYQAEDLHEECIVCGSKLRRRPRKENI